MPSIPKQLLPDVPDPGDIINPANPIANSLAQSAGEAIVNYVITALYQMLADAVAAITVALAGVFNSPTSSVDLVGGWFATESGRTVTAMTSTIAGALVLVFLLLALIRALFAGEFSAMWRAALVDVPAAFMGTAVTVTVAAALLTIVDEASVALLGPNGEQLAAFAESLTDAEQISGAGLLGMIFALIFIVGAVLVWIQLLIRTALIYVVIAFAPILWVTRAYPGTRNIARRGIEIGIALIVSKFVMAVAFRLGAEALASAEVPTGEADLSAMLIGAATMTLTAFMPWLIFRLIPIAEAATASGGIERSATGTAIVAGGVTYAGLRRLAGTNSNTSGGSNPASSVAASPAPSTAAGGGWGSGPGSTGPGPSPGSGPGGPAGPSGPAGGNPSHSGGGSSGSGGGSGGSGGTPNSSSGPGASQQNGVSSATASPSLAQTQSPAGPSGSPSAAATAAPTVSNAPGPLSAPTPVSPNPTPPTSAVPAATATVPSAVDGRLGNPAFTVIRNEDTP